MDETQRKEYESIVELVCQMADGYFSNVVSSAERQEKCRWLNEFEHHPLAWNVAVDLLSFPKHQVFATGMLTNKISLSWSTLMKDSKKELCDMVLVKIQDPTASHALRCGLCLSITQIIVQSAPHDWPDPISDTLFLCGVNPETGADTRITWIALVKSLAEEMMKPPKFISTTQHELLKGYCRETSTEKVVIKLLEVIQENCENPTSNLASEAMEALEQWMLLAPSVTPVMNQAVDVIISAILINPPMLAPSAAETFLNIVCLQTLHKYPKTLHFILEQVLRLEVVLDTVLAAEDLDTIESLVTIFTAVGIEHPGVLLKYPETGVKLANLVCRCSTVKEAITSECYDFWKELQDALIAEPDDENLQDLYKECFEDIVKILLQQSRYPLEELEATELAEFLKFRQESADCLLQLKTIIPFEELQIMYELIETMFIQYQESGSPEAESWIEVGLWGWQALSEALSEELVDEEEWPEKLIKIIYQLPQQSMRIQLTAVKLVGSMSHWLQKNPSAIPIALDYVIGALGNPDLATYAASALSSISEDCGELLLEYLSGLLDKLEPVMGYLKPADQCTVIGCLTTQVTFLEPEDALGLLVKLAGNLPHELLQLTQETNTFNSEQRLRLIQGLNFLNALFVSPGDPPERDDFKGVCSGVMVIHPLKTTPDQKYSSQVAWAHTALSPLIELTWGILEAIVNSAELDEQFCEPLLRYLTKALSSMKRIGFAPWISKTLNLLVIIFQRTHSVKAFEVYSTFAGVYRTNYTSHDLQLLLAAERADIVKLGLLAPLENAQAPPCEPIAELTACFNSFAEAALQLLHREDGTPDPAELNIFRVFIDKVAVATISYCPRVFFSNPAMSSHICQFAVDVIPLLAMVYDIKLCTKLIQYFYMIDSNLVLLPQDIPALTQFKEHLFGSLMFNVIRCIGGVAPRTTIPAFAHILFWFLTHFPQQLSSSLASVLEQEGFPTNSISMEQKKTFLSRILAAQRSEEAMGGVVHDMAVQCRGISSTLLGSIKPF